MQLPDLSLFAIMVVFWATYLVLRAFVFTPLGKILGEREATVSASSASLEAAVSREKEMLAAVEQKLTEARRGAMAARDAARQTASARRQAILDASRESGRTAAAEFQKKLEAEAVLVREELRKSAATMAAEIAQAALGRKVA